MTPKQKKIGIATGMFLSSILMIILLVFSYSEEPFQFRDVALVDSMIVENLKSYSISPNQIRARTIQTGNFSRIHYEVRIPSGLSKTQIHNDLHQHFYEAGIQVPAKVKLPSKDLFIYLISDETVFRTINLASDSSLRILDFTSSIAFFADSKPSLPLVERVHDLGEFIPLVFRTADPESAQNWYKQSVDVHQPIYVWINDPNRTNLLKSKIWLKDKLPQFASISRNLLLWADRPSAAKDEISTQFYRANNLKLLSIDNSVFLDAGEGIFTYEQSLRKFKQLATQNLNPVLFVRLNEKSVKLMEERVPDLKKLGLRFKEPIFKLP